MDANSTVENFITKELLSSKNIDTIGPDESLIDAGILDSFDLVRLIAFIEERYQIVVRDNEVMPDNFHSVNAISAFINSKI